jgi:outer membrane murein-binding lipoprotein Lpp
VTSPRLALAMALIAALAAGCATRADLLQQDRRVRAMLNDQRKAIDQLRREVERLRADVRAADRRDARAARRRWASAGGHGAARGRDAHPAHDHPAARRAARRRCVAP